MITIDKLSPIPLYKQIILQIKKEIILGRLKKGDKLPAIRELSERLMVNVNTVLKAYDRLAAEGIIDSEHGKGFFVKETTNISQDFIKDLKKISKTMKENGIELGLAMMLLQEVWNDEEV